MQTYIALLRGINVSGQKKIKMADLTKMFKDLNLLAVETYIQSGNIIFQSEKSGPSNLSVLIKDKIIQTFGYEVEVILLNAKDLRKIRDGNPFLEDPDRDIEKFYVTFLSGRPSDAHIEQLKSFDYSPEAYRLIDATIYFYAANGYGRAKMNNNFFESKLKVFATTRNWKTVNKLVDMSKKVS
jgi:uncharacterized protein (DUF1697 family)